MQKHALVKCKHHYSEKTHDLLWSTNKSTTMYRAGIVTLSIILKLMVGRVFALVAYYCCWNYWRCASKIEQIFHNRTQFVFCFVIFIVSIASQLFLILTSKTYRSYPGIAKWWTLLIDIWSCYNLFLTMSQIWIIEIIACDLFCLHLVVVERKEVWRGLTTR